MRINLLCVMVPALACAGMAAEKPGFRAGVARV